jgi:hypothetical protein
MSTCLYALLLCVVFLFYFVRSCVLFSCCVLCDTGFIITRRLLLTRQDLLTHPGHLKSRSVFSGVRRVVSVPLSFGVIVLQYMSFNLRISCLTIGYVAFDL